MTQDKYLTIIRKLQASCKGRELNLVVYANWHRCPPFAWVKVTLLNDE